MHLLIVEDDDETAAYMRKGLTEAGYTVDRMLPGLDGLAVVQAMRAAKIGTPVLILSALGQVDDRVKGLRAGGDDYLSKPFAFSELHARIEALLRRRDVQSVETKLTVGDLELDLLSRKVKRGDKPIDLQPREMRLLEYLMRHAGQVVTRTMLLEGVWDYHFDPQTNVIDVHISRLRQKLDKGFETPLLHTMRGAGYSIRAI
jgi:two-component system OmpR family response regulator